MKVIIIVSILAVGILSFGPDESKLAIVAGTVKDSMTGDILDASVSIEGAGLPAVNTEPGTGYYKMTDLPPGNHTFLATAQGYETEARSITVKAGEFVKLDFVLKRVEPKYGALTGRVFDRKEETPLVAELALTPAASLGATAEQPVAQTKSSASGIYTFADVPPGLYKISCRAANYVDQFITVEIEAGITHRRDIFMVKPGMIVTLRGIQFDFNKATIKSESAPILDEAAVILENNPGIRVEIQGHTDNIGSYSYNMRLSQRRAAAVVEYLVSIHGVNAARLESHGYGYTLPIADNASEEGRVQNRRVDFVILK